MKILYDNQIFSIQIFGGASKYYYELLERIPPTNWDTTTIFSNNEYIRNQELFNYCNFIPNHYFKGKATLMDYLNRPYTLLKLKYADYDIFHQTYFSTYYFQAIKGKKMVTTFHDINYTKYKELYKNTITNDVNHKELLQKKSVERADKIIAVSHNTKKDLVNIWDIDPEKIVVIHHGVDKKKAANLDNSRFIANPYILYVGERYGFKNFSRFIKAFAILSKKSRDLKLICTGRAFSVEERSELKDLDLIDKTIQISADERTMARLYRDAEMFVYPSYSEGFGMPVLEAMVYDCPVAVSNMSSIPEVAGEAGVYFDPFQVEDMAEKMKSLLTSPSLRKEKIAMGIKQLDKFSWEKTAQEHLAVYQSLM
jgi:glycosyltransferase involved in cell wall biosynthesis